MHFFSSVILKFFFSGKIIHFGFFFFFAFIIIHSFRIISPHMPTSSQSQILSVVDYQSLQQQQTSGQNVTTKPPVRIPVNQPAVNDSIRRQQKDERRTSIDSKKHENEHSSPLPRVNTRRRSSDKNIDSKLPISYLFFSILISPKKNNSNLFQKI